MKRTLILILSLVIMTSLFACTNEYVIEEYEPKTTVEVSDQTEILNDLIVALDEENNLSTLKVTETAVPLDEQILEQVIHGIGVTHEAHSKELTRFITKYKQYKELTPYVMYDPIEVKDQNDNNIVLYEMKDKNGRVSFQIQYTMTYNNNYCSEIFIKQNKKPTKKEKDHFKTLVECIAHSYAGAAVEFLGWEGQIGMNVNALITNGISLDDHIELVKTYEDGRIVAQIKSAKTNEE